MLNAPKIYKMRIAFHMTQSADHKHVFAALRRMVLGSGLPFEPAKVNKNWPRLSYGPALGFKQYAAREYADVYLSAPVKVPEVSAALAAAAPAGLKLLGVQRVPYGLPSVNNLAEVSKYAVTGDFAAYGPPMQWADFFGGRHILLTRTAPSGMKMQEDLKPFVLRAEMPAENRLELWLQKRGERTAKPEHVVAAWLGAAVDAEEEFTLEDLKFTREALYWRDAAGGLHAI